MLVRQLTSKPILITSKVENLQICFQNNFEIIFESLDMLEKAILAGLKNNLHLKIDSGMHRYGTNSVNELLKINQKLEQEKIKLCSISTHFSQTSNSDFTKNQYFKFLNLKKIITQNPPVCFGGSGVYDYDFEYDILRLGIGLYGYENKNLQKVMKIYSYISKIFFAKKGEFIGYNQAGLLHEDALIAVVPVGYGDGLRRGLCNNFSVEINGKEYFAIGNICMDCFFVVVDTNIHEGDLVCVFNDVQKFAKTLNTNSYEVLTGFSNFRGDSVII